MFGRKTAKLALVAGLTLASAALVVPTASAGEKAAASNGPSSRAVQTGQASSASHARAPQVARVSSSRAGSKTTSARPGARAGQASSASAVYRSCYAYSNGTGDLCLFYYQNYVGSRGGVYSNDPNLVDNYFTTAGYGQYQSMTNNAESDYNYDYYYTAWTATLPNYYGYNGYVSTRSGGNFSSTYTNNVESVHWT